MTATEDRQRERLTVSLGSWGHATSAGSTSEHLLTLLATAAVLSGHSPMKKATAAERKVGTSLGSPPFLVVVGSENVTPPSKELGWYMQTVAAMDIILSCHALFDLVKKLALEVLFPAPFQT